MEIPELVAVASTCSTYWVQLTAKIQAVLKIRFHSIVENFKIDNMWFFRNHFCNTVRESRYPHELTLDALYKWVSAPNYLYYLFSLTFPLLSYFKATCTPVTKIMFDVQIKIDFTTLEPINEIIINLDYEDDYSVVTLSLIANDSLVIDSGETLTVCGYKTPLYHFNRDCIDKFVKLDLSNIPRKYDMAIIL